MIRRLLILCCLFYARESLAQPGQQTTGYLFTYFTSNDREGESIRFAVSTDGFRFHALNRNRPVLSSADISSTGGVRDPHILRRHDGRGFLMVATDMVSALGWNSNRAMVLLRSDDLVHWTSKVVNIQRRFPGQDSLLRVWAPQTIYDARAGKYMIYWSMKHGMNEPDKIYYAYANEDFTDLATPPRQLFFPPDGGACIDGDIVEKDGRFHLFFKTEGRGAGIKVAVSDRLTEGYAERDPYVQQTRDPVEGAGVYRLNGSDEYVLMYDVYTSGTYQFCRTRDLEHFRVADEEVSMDFHPRHGTVMPVTDEEIRRLVKTWGYPEMVLGSLTATGNRKINTRIDTGSRIIDLSLRPGADPAELHPAFPSLPGIQVSIQGPLDPAGRTRRFRVTVDGRKPEVWTIWARREFNPVLEGFYADPDIMYSRQTGKYYLYPTSDGFSNWSGTFFKTFSSTDLASWKDEGVILDLPRDVSWGKRNAWAPCILEKKTGDRYHYLFYYTAAQRIGVAVADAPTGPFRDIGKPLLERFPEGLKGGQVIDPDVFTDPVSGRDYLYWGNGHMLGGMLAEDGLSLVESTVKVITPDRTFREGTTVFYRNGRYFFLWSENDTRSPDYRVRWGSSASPLGPIEVPADNILLEKDTIAGIYGTGHNSVLNIPGTDEWYIVYHRFNHPRGIGMGRSAGYHREVCFDRLSFDAAGRPQRVIPTLRGVPPLRVRPEDLY
jgi:beta-xylosidase